MPPGSPPSAAAGGCEDDNDAAKQYAASLGVNIKGCVDAVPYCDSPLDPTHQVRAHCCAACASAKQPTSASAAAAVAECADDDAALMKLVDERYGGGRNRIYGDTCATGAAGFCTIAPVAQICPVTCQYGCGAPRAAADLQTGVMSASHYATVEAAVLSLIHI